MTSPRRGQTADPFRDVQDLEDRIEKLTRRLNTDVVTSLPDNPYNGQVISFLADDTNGVIWNLRYRLKSLSSYKWEYVGGPTLYQSTGTVSSASTTPVLLSGPAITLPLTGDYDITMETRGYNQNAAGGIADVTLFAGGGNTGITLDPYQGSAGAGVTLWSGNLARTTRVTGFGIGAVVDLRVSVNTGTGQWDYRTLRIVPVRVG